MALSAYSDELANVRTEKKEFLAQIDRIVPWGNGSRKSDRAIIKESAETSPTIWN